MKCRQKLDLGRVLSFRRINKKGEFFNQEIQKITASNLKNNGINIDRKKYLEEIIEYGLIEKERQ